MMDRNMKLRILEKVIEPRRFDAAEAAPDPPGLLPASAAPPEPSSEPPEPPDGRLARGCAG